MFQLPVFKDHKLFEEFICELFNEIDNSGDSYQLYGRLGQRQNGVDVYSYRKKTAIQCKLKDINQTLNQIKNNLKLEIKKELLNLKNFQNEFNRYIITSTFNDDKDIQDYVISINNEKKYKFEIIYWGWETIVRQTNFYRSLLWKYFDILTNNRHNDLKILLFVSLGGTCRDPLAKAITMKLLERKEIKKSLIIKNLGLYPGDDISFAAKFIIKEYYNQTIPNELKPNSISKDLISDADLILLMDSYIKDLPRNLFPNNKTYLFTEFFGSDEIIHDPFPDGKDVKTIERYRNTAKKIEYIISNKIQYLIDILELN